MQDIHEFKELKFALDETCPLRPWKAVAILTVPARAETKMLQNQLASKPQVIETSDRPTLPTSARKK